MKHLISITECLGIRETTRGASEVCATADASYDEATNRISVKLDSYLRPVPARAGADPYREPWLPDAQLVNESVSQDEGDALARDVFHSWINRVRQSMPPTHA